MDNKIQCDHCGIFKHEVDAVSAFDGVWCAVSERPYHSWDKPMVSPSLSEYKQIMKDALDPEKTPSFTLSYKDGNIDVINRAPHYNFSKIEPIDVIEAWGLGFLDGNVVKYIARRNYKNGLEDLKKARWYLDRLINNLEKEWQAGLGKQSIGC